MGLIDSAKPKVPRLKVSKAPAVAKVKVKRAMKPGFSPAANLGAYHHKPKGQK